MPNKFKSQNEYLDELAELRKQYPEYPVKFFASYDSFAEEEGYFVEHEIYKIEISFYCVHGDKLLLDKEYIIEELLEELYSIDSQEVIDSHENDNYYEDLVEEAFQIMVKERQVITAICVYTR